MKAYLFLAFLIVIFSGCTSEINDFKSDYSYSSIPEEIGSVFLVDDPLNNGYSLMFSLLDNNQSNIDYFGNVSITIRNQGDLSESRNFVIEFSKDDFMNIKMNDVNNYMATLFIEGMEYDESSHYIVNISIDVNGSIISGEDDNYHIFFPLQEDKEASFIDNSVFLNEGFYLNGLSIIIKRYGLYEVYDENVLRIDVEIRNPNPFVIKFYDYESVLIKDGLQFERVFFNQDSLDMIYKNSVKEVSYYFRTDDNITGNVTVVFGRSYDSNYREYYHEHKMDLRI